MAVVLASAHPAYPHAFEFTEADVVIYADGQVQATIPFHIDALLAQVPLGDPSEEDYARLREMPAETFDARMAEVTEYLRTSVRLKFDGTAIEPAIRFPEREKQIEAGMDGNALPGEFFVLEAEVPEDAERFVYTASPMYRLTYLRVFDERGHGLDKPAHEEPVNPGALSTPYAMAEPYVPPPVGSVVGQYLVLGFEHIVPLGADHILFVLGLFFLSMRLSPLAWQITMFTVAHTITLALAAADLVMLPSAVVEPLIALSIVFVGVENCLTNELKWWRPLAVFGFGLLHGLGFAGALSEFGLPEGRFLTALLSFNAGVEIGQLAVVAIAFLAFGWFRRHEWFRARIAIPGSVLIAAAGLYWFAARIMV